MANVKTYPIINIEDVFDRDKTICSVEIKLNTNFNYRVISSAFPDQPAYTTTNVSLGIDECESIQDIKASILQESTSVCNDWIIKSVINSEYTLEEWKNIQNEFLKKVLDYIGSDKYEISNMVFVDKTHGLTFSICCQLYFVKQVAFI